MLHGVTRGYGGYIKLQGVTVGYIGLHGVTIVYRGLQGVTVGYKRLQWVTRGYGGLHEVLTLRSFLKSISFMKTFPQ